MGYDRGAASTVTAESTDDRGPERTVPVARRDEPVENWRRIYARRLWMSDLLVLVWVVFGTQIAWFGFGAADLAIEGGLVDGEVSYWAASTALIIVWMLALSLADTRDHRVIGAGSAEYARIARSSVTLFGVIAIIAFLTQIEVARGFLLLSLPLGILILLFERWLWRHWLIAKRSSGAYSARVLLVGSRRSVVDIANELLRTPSAGYHVVGACVPGGAVADTIEGTGIPIMGSISALPTALEVSKADTVVVTSTDELPADKVKQISWGLEAGRQHLVLAPGIADIAGPRISSRPVAGLPLLHVETPRFSGGQRVLKRIVDVVAAVVGVILISPVLAFLALSIRLSSPGPVFFRQQRIGHGGREFTMLKFRSMVVDAEARLAALMDQERDAGNAVLFKMKHDPRVTPIGRIMRRLSLDELPQLFNVIGGSMSLVGPRPPLPREVELYADHVHRRFLVKPGITGLWQVSGRSSLSWEESVRLDLSYVENWTLVGDVVILFKTARAALLPGDTAF
ncbi:sugar transferase [Microbacterium sp. EYE_5]|uniref:sugar transferase n=1 Tax=unclassified Microbacterium TaxID=2609290 RepID=UPI002003E835|nr:MULTISPECIES: sugar transferase [unclassified Microbacterium]MCK6079059.1 sugar transferase [Microbacterium sp. EYE_382]MCK6084329.1 sugar transferase [Microbacterium sp. EYE_384]MCK6123442.1 sugar transferase [Microbacterium sp. EYE_80]MCK6125093.1 sugar transferase [Microbacterium sp. EYE_79]MCK6140013.1 sugar transferase [Microbacterium sp. EYE_39]